jgi:hypothetical protein
MAVAFVFVIVYICCLSYCVDNGSKQIQALPIASIWRQSQLLCNTFVWLCFSIMDNGIVHLLLAMGELCAAHSLSKVVHVGAFRASTRFIHVGTCIVILFFRFWVTMCPYTVSLQNVWVLLHIITSACCFGIIHIIVDLVSNILLVRYN